MASYGHHIFFGQTESGKTTAATALSQWYAARSIKSLILDPMMDPRWAPGSVVVRDVDEFMAIARDPDQCMQCALFVDESGTSMSRYLTTYEWLTTQSRHFGHVAHLITQRAAQISLTMRSQCSVLYCFNVNPKDAKSYAEDFNAPELLKAPSLPQGHCIRVQRFKPVRYLKMW